MTEFLDALHRGEIIIQAVIPAEAGIQKQQQNGFRIKCGMTAFFCVFQYFDTSSRKPSGLRGNLLIMTFF